MWARRHLEGLHLIFRFQVFLPKHQPDLDTSGYVSIMRIHVKLMGTFPPARMRTPWGEDSDGFSSSCYTICCEGVADGATDSAWAFGWWDGRIRMHVGRRAEERERGAGVRWEVSGEGLRYSSVGRKSNCERRRKKETKDRDNNRVMDCQNAPWTRLCLHLTARYLCQGETSCASLSSVCLRQAIEISSDVQDGGCVPCLRSSLTPPGGVGGYAFSPPTLS